MQAGRQSGGINTRRVALTVHEVAGHLRRSHGGHEAENCKHNEQLNQRMPALATTYRWLRTIHLGNAKSLMLRIAVRSDAISPPTISPSRIVKAGTRMARSRPTE